MRIYEFMDKYCQDLITEHHEKKDLIDLAQFPHDGFDTDDEGSKIAVVYSGGHNIPVQDFFTLRRDDFLSVWKHAEAAETFDNYVAGLEILEGIDVINKIRNQILAERKRLNHDVDMVTMI